MKGSSSSSKLFLGFLRLLHSDHRQLAMLRSISALFTRLRNPDMQIFLATFFVCVISQVALLKIDPFVRLYCMNILVAFCLAHAAHVERRLDQLQTHVEIASNDDGSSGSSDINDDQTTGSTPPMIKIDASTKTTHVECEVTPS